jgi:fructokinase
MSRLYGGVETGGTWCVCAIGSGPTDIVTEEQFPTSDPEQTLERIVRFFTEADSVLEAIGIGSFGPVDLDRSSPTWGHVTTTPKPGWQHVPVAPVIAERLGVEVVFDNDVNAAALGEYRWGAGRDAASVCYLTVGTGIGAGLLIDGRPRHGLVHPEVGHIRIPRQHVADDQHFRGICPVHGDCWEGIASGPAIAARWQTPAEQLDDEHPAWELEAEHLALGILSIVLVASPERVIVGGGVTQRPQLLPMVRRRLRDLVAGYLETPMLADTIDEYLVPPALGDRSGVLGAIALAHGASARGP